jgi:hypothetical protein
MYFFIHRTTNLSRLRQAPCGTPSFWGRTDHSPFDPASGVASSARPLLGPAFDGRYIFDNS